MVKETVADPSFSNKVLRQCAFYRAGRYRHFEQAATVLVNRG
jgi:hypothetical protein